MSSQADICNLASSILGKPTITSITEGTTVANAYNAVWDTLRRAGIMGPGTWRFSVRRASLPAMTAVPVSGPYTRQFQLPGDCLAVIMAGDFYPGMDLSDYRQGPNGIDYSIEGTALLSNLQAPLPLLYKSDVTDTTQFDPNFERWLGAELAWWTCEKLTGSNEMQQLCNARRKEAWYAGLAAGAVQMPPQYPADDSWVTSRMQ